ncbi:Phospho-2-dehydro-3-deoxyheptonate aldolase phenylalanine-inhibited [Spathaspora sp. JA1]|nr:Phospho-2-dehydro-3-deoxyheptonate aldolase phenylalanine-inhibited [Spathaspora sp. JA1]
MSVQPQVQIPQTPIEKSIFLESSSSSTTEPGSPVINAAPEWDYHPPASTVTTNTKTPIAIPQPEVMQNILYPLPQQLKTKILYDRTQINNSLTKTSPLLVIVGPSYIKTHTQIKACAQYLGIKQGKPISDDFLPSEIKSSNHTKLSNLQLTLRTNLSKYNHPYQTTRSTSTTIRTFEIDSGLPKCRALLRDLSPLVPLVSEFNDTLTPQYLGDCFSMGIIGPTLIESQLHRELASGTSYAVGFNTGNEESEMLDHKLTSCLDAMFATSQPHQFLSITKHGTVAVVGTTGNNDTFVILPGDCDVVKCITKINSYKNLQERSIKVLIDLGKVNELDYDIKLNNLKKILTSELASQVLGVMIDSGDNYTLYDDEQDQDDIESLLTLNQF